jgi:hypothetical protein
MRAYSRTVGLLHQGSLWCEHQFLFHRQRSPQHRHGLGAVDSTPAVCVEGSAKQRPKNCTMWSFRNGRIVCITLVRHRFIFFC